jgi:hypothetical protein
MDYFAGLDVSVKETSVSIVDGTVLCPLIAQAYIRSQAHAGEGPCCANVLGWTVQDIEDRQRDRDGKNAVAE